MRHGLGPKQFHFKLMHPHRFVKYALTDRNGWNDFKIGPVRAWTSLEFVNSNDRDASTFIVLGRADLHTLVNPACAN